MARALGVIPARLNSTRMKEKVLQQLHGRPMIQHVWERAKQARKLDEVIVACDDPRIEKCVKEFGGKAMLTSPDHKNGTSRVAEVAKNEAAEVIINIQGDEPLIHPDAIDSLVREFNDDSDIEVATLAVQREDRDEYNNPNVVKVVFDQNFDALYFSRSPIPHYREGAAVKVPFMKHLGIYGYKKAFLLKFVQWEMGKLEDDEKLEQLRILEKGFKIRVVQTQHNSLSVDTSDDLDAVQSVMNQKGGL